MDQAALHQIAGLQNHHALLHDQVVQIILRRRQRRRRRRRPRRFWVRPWLAADRRLLYGHFDKLMVELRLEDEHSFHNFLRMYPPLFDEILVRITPRIERQDTHYRKAISPGVRLALTLRHLASGDRYSSIMYSFRVSLTSIIRIIPSVCQAIVEEFKDEVIACPTTPHRCFPAKVECSSCLWCLGWQTCAHQETPQVWFVVFQLQGILFGYLDGTCRRRLQIPLD